MSQHYADLKLLIGGEWTPKDHREHEPVMNPATGECIGVLPHASKADLDRALDAAEQANPVWRGMSPQDRGKILKRAADLMRERVEHIARIATIEEGKNIHEARMETNISADTLEWFAEEGRRAYGRVLPQRSPGMRMTVLREPVGPVAALAPWNFPVGNPCRKLGAALAAGCPCILKPAEHTPASALEVGRALMDAGLPKGVMSIVFGVPSQISTHLIASPIIRKVSFTGSTRVGKQLMKLAADGVKRTTMELGGHAPVIVFDDVDVETVLDLSATSKFRNAGQVCVSPTRYYVHERIYQRFVDGFAARASSWTVGDGLVDTNKMGPLAHSLRLNWMEEMLTDAKKHGAHFDAGGSRIPGPGYFWEPTVISEVPNEARIMNEEPFGPIAIINPFSDFGDVIKQANRLPYGLAAYAFTRSNRTVNLLGEQLEAGLVGINSYLISVRDSPFGGVKESGHGSEEGMEGLEACLVTKFISES
ncbi:MAG TPA: NAD-dependent succinate-semialdehyde dehydrogenase [Bryobacteraceae bacterium]|jgi:succinate-semialdehyde dehydrogenase / glutarate-semialdehyde dehydrogenase|nr:NAD-dependent succinate-semialdehyde dehydrogenase [Bryobacteraceae bacterium]